MTTKHLPRRDYVSRYLGRTVAYDTPVEESAAIHLGILKQMHIKLSQEEIEYLFSLPTEVAIENWCRSIIMARL